MPDIKKLEEELGAAKLREKMMQDEIERQDAEISEKDAQIASISSLTAASVAEKPTIPDTTFSIEGVEYRFLVAGFRHGNRFYTAKEALEMPELLVEIIPFGIVAKA